MPIKARKSIIGNGAMPVKYYLIKGASKRSLDGRAVKRRRR